MGISLGIEATSCIRCGHCVAVCPAHIFSQESGERGAIGLQNVSSCIVCGHCAAVCPTGAVVHSAFPADTIHPIDRAGLPTPEQVLALCRARRSNRAFSRKPVPRESLELILEAAHRAPTASNAQEVGFTWVTDPERLKRVIELTIDTFDGVARKLENPILRPVLRRIMPQVYRYLPNFHRLVAAWREQGEDLILRGATAVLFIHTPAGARFGQADANLAYQNGSLMAESLGVSQFYTGFVCSAVGQDRRGRFAELLGLDKGRRIQAGMAVGMPSFRFPNYMDKQPVEAAWL